MERGTTATPTFADADARRRELTERQLHVLQLVAEGHTNWEIGEALGITLDGAKWNVSELLSKLGLNSREELADYWRWHNRRSARLGRAFRGLFGLPALKLAGGVGGAATLAVFAWALFSGGADSAVQQGVPPFELVAQVTVLDNSRTVGTNIAGSTVNPVVQVESKSIVRWSLKDATHSRSEIQTIAPALEARTLVVAISGDTTLSYDSATNSYSKTASAALPDGWVMSPVSSMLFGPVPFDNRQALLDSLRQSGGPSTQANVVGEETVLGRDTAVIEVGPTGRYRGSDGVESGFGSMRLWLDEDRMFVMRAASEGSNSGQSYEMEVTELDYAMPANKVDVSFEPPADAKEASPNGSSGNDYASSSGAGVSNGQLGGMSSARFLNPSFLPAGYPSSGERSESNTNNESIALESTFTQASSAGGAYLRIEQRKRADGLPAALQTSDKTTVNGHPAYRGVDGTAKTLAWAQDGIAVLLTADALPYAELERVANSMTLR